MVALKYYKLENVVNIIHLVFVITAIIDDIIWFDLMFDIMVVIIIYCDLFYLVGIVLI